MTEQIVTTDDDTTRGATLPEQVWDNPHLFTEKLDEVAESGIPCQQLELTSNALPCTRHDFQELGVTGIEFAAFKTAHPSGLGTDLMGLHTHDLATTPGNLYRVNRESYFTQLDIRQPLPFEDDCLDWVYAEHLIEHVTLEVAVAWLTEVRRVLTPGGLLRLTTPDLRKYLESYVRGDDFLTTHRRRLRVFGDSVPDRRAFMINQIFYFYGHCWIYDEEELRHVVGRAGFDASTAQRTMFKQGARLDVARLDRGFRRDETIYLELRK
ncbi:class I SAM-dependent methyltransferase [Amycolatopsis sp. NPDC004378]